MEKIENATCIKFEDRNQNQHKETVRTEIHRIFTITQFEFKPVFIETWYKDYLEFFHGNDCHSNIGRKGRKQQIILSPKCAEEHTLIHEVDFF